MPPQTLSFKDFTQICQLQTVNFTKMCPLFYHECAEAKRKCAEAERKITWKILQVFNVYIFTTLFIFDLRTIVANLALSQLRAF